MFIIKLYICICVKDTHNNSMTTPTIRNYFSWQSFKYKILDHNKWWVKMLLEMQTCSSYLLNRSELQRGEKVTNEWSCQPPPPYYNPGLHWSAGWPLVNLQALQPTTTSRPHLTASYLNTEGSLTLPKTEVRPVSGVIECTSMHVHSTHTCTPYRA